MTTPPRTIHTADTAPIPVQGHTQTYATDPHQYPGARPAEPESVFVAEEDAQKRPWLRGCGVFALVVSLLVIALIAAVMWAGPKLLQAGEDAVFGVEEPAPAAPAAPEPVADPVAPPVEELGAQESGPDGLRSSVDAMQLPDTNWATDKARRIAFTAATATEHGLVGANSEETYDKINGLCSALAAGADPAPMLYGFVDDNSTAVTAAPFAKIAATGMGIQCPDQYTAAAQNLQYLAPEMEIPAAPSYQWLP